MRGREDLFVVVLKHCAHSDGCLLGDWFRKRLWRGGRLERITYTGGDFPFPIS